MQPKVVDVNSVTDDSKEIYFYTRFNFLLSHNGIRKNKLHTILAPTHSGKSTLIRSLVVDAMIMNPKKLILVWLSEESSEEFTKEIKKCIKGTGIKTDNLLVISDIDYSDQIAELSDTNFKAKIKNIITQNEVDILFFDNITTSELYNDKKPTEQSGFSKWLKSLTKITTIVCVAHTNTDNFNNRLLDLGDIRGNNTIINESEFAYILQPVNIGETLMQFLVIKKNRSQDVIGRFYKLNYCKKLFAFKDDLKIEFQIIAEKFKLRNKL